MSWICRSAPQPLLAVQPLLATEFRTLDPASKQIHQELLRDEPQQSKYEGWRRIRLQTVDSKAVLRALRENGQHFEDPSFPHDNSVLSKDYFHENIEWLRVREVVENAVYSKEMNNKTLEKVQLNRPEFEKALVLIARSSPSMFQELLSKSLNPEGLYEFKLFRGGYIRNVVIDDYIPTDNGRPIFVSPVRENEVYPMLLEKAIAKVCGSYEEIPESAEEIMEMIFCGPVQTKKVLELREKELLGQTLQGCIRKKELAVLVSKRDPKIRNYGLNENEVYRVINHHAADVEGTQEEIYELVSESKLSAWNGRFSLNDAVWQRVPLQKKNDLYLQIKNNRSFCISERDVSKHFDELLIFESAEVNNKDWIQNTSQTAFPSFTTFTVPSPQRIFLRATLPSRARQLMILVRELAEKKYEFIDSKFHQNSSKVESSMVLEAGKYILGVYHEELLSNTREYFVFLSSTQHIRLKTGGLLDNDFLNRALLSYEATKHLDPKEKNKLYKICMELEKFGLAYILLRPTASKTKRIKIDIDQEKLGDDGWEVLEPYTSVSTISVSEDNTLVVLLKRDIDFDKKIHFPAVAFKLKE